MPKKAQQEDGADKLSTKDRITLGGSMAALAISLFTFAQENLLNQHVLKAMVVGVGGQGGDVAQGKLLLVNGGKHYEVLYDAIFVFGPDAAAGKGLIATEGVGPTVLKPGESTVIPIAGKIPDSVRAAVVGTGQVEVGVRLRAFDSKGTFTNDGKVFRYAIWKYENGHPVAAVPVPLGTDKLIDLL